MTDYATQRLNMVESQVRTSDVTDRRITRAMRAIPREEFAPALQKSIAYADDHLRVSDAGGRRRYLLAPRLIAKLVQLLEIADDALVLDIGPATGYSTALLARLCQTAIGVEEDRVLAERAEGLLTSLGVDNAVIVSGPLAAGVAGEGPYDAILVNGTIAAEPTQLLGQLKDGGRLVAVSVVDGVGRAVVWSRHGNSYDRRLAFDATAPSMPGFEREVAFEF